MAEWWIDYSKPVGPKSERTLEEIKQAWSEFGTKMMKGFSTLGSYTYEIHFPTSSSTGKTLLETKTYDPPVALPPPRVNNTGPRPDSAFSRSGEKRY